MSADGSAQRPRRERSARYPGATLEESLELCEAIDRLGLDNLSAAAVAEGLGYSNIKTNTFSAPLSAARQFGLLDLADERYRLTPLARSLLHPDDPGQVPNLRREALLRPRLYGELAERLENRRVPEPAILANILYHHHQITARAKEAAAELFLESARFAGAMGDDGIFRKNGIPPAPRAAEPVAVAGRDAPPRARGADVRLDLRLWDEDEGKIIRVRAPRSITAASLDRFLQAFRLLVRIEERPRPGSGA